MNILIIEDDKTILEFLRDGLAGAGHVTDAATGGEEGLSKALAGGHDLILLDLMLPDLDGVAVLDRIKDAGIKTPIIVLSARASVEDKVHCLNSGCDDYLTKPFALSELLARINAITRRGARAEETTLVRDDVTIDLIQRKVRRGGREIELKSKEFQLLLHLMENAGQVVTRSMIMKRVWGYDFDPGTNIIDVYVCQLRDKIDSGSEPRLIHTVRGAGYVFKKG